MSEKKKCRQYSIDYLKYGFIASPTNMQQPLCLLCEKSFSNEAMKPSRLSEHLTRVHSDKADKSLSFFQGLKVKYENRATVGKLFKKAAVTRDKGLVASYNISYLIAKLGKPHTIGETLVVPAIREFCTTVLGIDGGVLKSLPLSNNTVARRIKEMADDVEEALFAKLRDTEFAMAVDESTLRDSEALLLAYVRYIDKEIDEFKEDLLFARQLISDTKGSSIYKVVVEFFEEKAIPLINLLACATDGAPAMFGRYAGLLALLKKLLPGLLGVHCVIHRQHLAAKHLSGRLNETLQFVIRAVNKVKAQPLNDRMFRLLCQDNEEDYERLLMHTAVRWLSKGKCLKRVDTVFPTLLEFLGTVDEALRDELANRRLDIAYLADIFEKQNEVNTKLQGGNMNFIKAKGIVCSFISKLGLYRRNLSSQELSQFPSLQEKVKMSANEDEVPVLPDSDLRVYCSHLEELKIDMETRFQDLLSLEVPSWVINPFTSNPEEFDPKLQEHLIDVKHDDEAKELFQKYGYENFWVKVRRTYPVLWQEAKLLLLAFPSTYLVETGFSTVQEILTKARNKLQICETGDLRLRLTKMQPDVEKLAEEHQAQGSH